MDDDDDIDFDMDFNIPENAQNGSIHNDEMNESGENSSSMRYQNDSESKIVEHYKKLEQESLKLDEAAREIKNMMIICKQMEKCYSRRVLQTDAEMVVNVVQMNYLHNGGVLLRLNVKNPTNLEMNGWMLCVEPELIKEDNKITSILTSQTIQLGCLPGGVSKSFELAFSGEFRKFPIVFHMKMIRIYSFGEIRKVFRIDIDSYCLTTWSLAEMVLNSTKKPTLNFDFVIRLPSALIDLLCGCPDTVSTTNVLRAVLPTNIADKISNTSQILLNMRIDESNWQIIELESRRSGEAYELKVSTQTSLAEKQLKYELLILLITQMGKIKSRPSNGMKLLPEFGGSAEELFNSMLSSF